MDNCVECKENSAKYKCPKCYAKYCSVVCCKLHKAKDCEPVKKKDIPKASETEIASKSALLESSLESEDFVPADKLALLVTSEEVKECLANPHLRAMMENLVNSEDPSQEMDAALREPIFSEFATACLRVVEQEPVPQTEIQP